MTSPDIIHIENVVKSYPMGDRELTVLKGINMSITKGEMAAIMGPSGSGKSTILNIIGCLDVPSSGNYQLDGQEVSQMTRHELAYIRSQKIGFVFQQFNLLSQFSALANVELGLYYGGIENMELAKEALDRVGLSDRMKHRPRELSGGEQQRVAIARALAKKPPLILADEPTGNLDSRSGEEIMGMLKGLHQDGNVTLVMITHDPDIAHQCQRVIYIRDGLVIGEEKR